MSTTEVKVGDKIRIIRNDLEFAELYGKICTIISIKQNGIGVAERGVPGWLWNHEFEKVEEQSLVAESDYLILVNDYNMNSQKFVLVSFTNLPIGTYFKVVKKDATQQDLEFAKIVMECLK